MRRLVKAAFDIAIIGSGFAGSLLAAICRRLGRSVVLLEKGAHPRFAIGESSTPLANLLLEELAARYDLPRIAPLTKWGSWQDTHPQLACGLKRGFTFYHHHFGEPFRAATDRSDQLLVAASPHDAIADTHWYRADFDQFLVGEAQAAGVEYWDRVALESVSFAGDFATLAGTRSGQRLEVRARLVLDASGPRGFLHSALHLGEAPLPHLPPTQSLFTHFSGVAKLGDLLPSGPEPPPYPVDDAAVHHVFPGGWIWVLRFNNGVTSAGVAATEQLARDLDLASAAGWQRLLDRLPTVREQFADAQPQRPFVHAPRLAFRSARIAGPRWALLPSAAGFVDPLLSTGFPLTLLGVGRLAEIIERDWSSPRLSASLSRYASATEAELLAAGKIVAALYAHLDDFALFAALTRLYFTAASFSECARRLRRPHLAGSFLMHDVPAFGPRCRSILDRALAHPTALEKRALTAEIADAIQPFDIAGLGVESRRNWHSADAGDLFRAAGKLGATEPEIATMLARCGFPSAAADMLLEGRARASHPPHG